MQLHNVEGLLDEEKPFRRIVCEEVSDLDMPRVVHLPGLDLLDRPQGLSTDLVHPSVRGMSRIADGFVECVMGLIHEVRTPMSIL